MNFSEDWKSLWSISSVHSPPLLLSGSSAKPLGPLFFTPSPQTLTPLFSSPSLLPSIPPPSHFSLRNTRHTLTRPSKDPFIPPSVISSIAADFSAQSDGPTTPIPNNNLQLLRCDNNNILFFFPTGENSDQIGFVKLSITGSKPETTVDDGGKVFTTERGLKHRILKISVISVVGMSSNFPLASGNSITVGFLLVCTMYSVHWFRVEISNLDSDLEKPVLVHLCIKEFSHSVAHACWNPHLPEECLVLLENGELFLFDLGSCSRVGKLPMKLKGTRVEVSWKDFDLDSDSGSGSGSAEKVGWLNCDFGWHPRIFIVAYSNAVFLVDWRSEECNVSTLAKIEMLDLKLSAGTDRFIAFCKAGIDGFYFTVATEYHLLLFDTRRPLTPVLQWAHGLDNPHYISVFRLSELRSGSEEYRWASESGFAILLGSFWNCEFSLFCYGPSLPAPDASVASRISRLYNTFYAWELPSELSLLDCQCRCGDNLLRDEFSKAMLPKWVDWRQKKEMVMGFGIIGEDLSDSQPESDGLGRFTLIRLVSSGKLESQIYHASWDFISAKSEESMEQTSSQVEDSLLYPLGDQKYKFPRRFKYIHLDYLCGYLIDDLAKVLITNMQNPSNGPSETLSYTQDSRELILGKLKAAGVDQIGSFPAISNVLNDISLPMSINEIASSRMWAGLPMDLLQLAFSKYSELLEVLVDQKKVSLDSLDVPDLPQLPPFFLRKPSSRSNRCSHKVQPGDALVGPVLPLPVLLTLREIDKERSCAVLEEEANGFSVETELTHQCSKVMKVANDMALPGSCSELNDSHTVSLADDRDEKYVDSQESKSLFIYKPCAFLDKKNPIQEKPIFEEDKYATFISKTCRKEFSSNPKKELVGLEVFDELCPVDLKFDFPPMNFGPTELEKYKLLKRQFSGWQDGFKQYQDFCTASKILK